MSQLRSVHTRKASGDGQRPHLRLLSRSALGAIREEGLLRLRRVATPYVSRAGRHFDPNVTTYTDRLLRWIDGAPQDDGLKTSRNPKSDVNPGKARGNGTRSGTYGTGDGIEWVLSEISR